MNLYDHHKDWLKHNGKVITIDGLKYRINVSSYNAIYPYPCRLIEVYAEPVSKTSKHYKEIKAKLKDDWSLDLLDFNLDDNTYASIDKQLGGIYSD